MKSSRRAFIGSAAVLNSRTAFALSQAGATSGPASIHVSDNVIQIETSTLTAKIEKGFLTSLRSKASGEEFITEFDKTASDALQLIYRQGEAVNIGEQKFGRVEARKISDTRAELVFQNWDGDGIIAISADAATGDLLIEPSAYSSRPGVRSCRWLLKGLRRDLRLVAPMYQGVSLALDDALIRNTHWEWPQAWGAAFVILQAGSGGFWVHTQDSHYRYKALHAGSSSDPFMLAFDTEAYGPIDNNLASGGLVWRINVHQGDWKVPAERYRRWLWSAFSLDKEEQLRQPWIHKLAMAISWCPGDINILETLAESADPRKILIHFSNWRTDAYDENYPTYVASDSASQFLARARGMGFHVMPHFNAIETDPNNPVYSKLRDFQYRHIETKKLYGWSWVKGRAIGVPESNAARLDHRSEKVMVKIHPGLAMWRSILCNRIDQARLKHNLEDVFVDVALNTFNLDNSLVQNMTSSEGMNCLIREIAALGLSVGAEGLNETFIHGLSFAQVHLFRSHQSNGEGLERTGGCALNNFLFGKLVRSFGYTALGGRNAAEELRARIHEEHEALPTITIRSAADIANPAPAVKRALDHARR